MVLDLERESTRTPGAATRPRSLRRRSTIIRFSARSFSEWSRVSRRRFAGAGLPHRPRGEAGAPPFEKEFRRQGRWPRPGGDDAAM